MNEFAAFDSRCEPLNLVKSVRTILLPHIGNLDFEILTENPRGKFQ